MPKNKINSTYFVKLLKITKKLRLKCDYNDVIMVLFPVLWQIQNYFVYKMIAVLKQINKPLFKNFLRQKVLLFDVVNVLNFLYLLVYSGWVASSNCSCR